MLPYTATDMLRAMRVRHELNDLLVSSPLLGDDGFDRHPGSLRRQVGTLLVTAGQRLQGVHPPAPAG